MIIKLLEIKHGQWLYRNVMVCDSTTGTLIKNRKEEIQLEIESQQELGSEILLEEDNVLPEVWLEDLESTNGGRQEYCLVATKSARKEKAIRYATTKKISRKHKGSEINKSQHNK